jgi:hypothetical protein
VRGLHLAPYSDTGTITNLYDIYIVAPTDSTKVTNHYSIYQAATTAKNYFGSPIYIDTTSSASSAKLSLGNNIDAKKLAVYDGSSNFYGFGLRSGYLDFYSGDAISMSCTSTNNVLIGDTLTNTDGIRLKVDGGAFACSGGICAGSATTDAGDGNIRANGAFYVDDKKVVGDQVVDARCDDTINTSAWDSTTAGVLDSLRDAMIAHGLIAAS